jgi:hypothetical protein
MRLGTESERRDLVKILEANRRQLAFRLPSAELLRKGRTPPQRHRMATARKRLRADVLSHLDDAGRKAFRGPVAVELELALPPSSQSPAGLPPVVKDYVDLLTKTVVPDDSYVEHLLVRRTKTDGADVVATFRFLPISVFAPEFDRAFRLLPEISAGEVERPGRFVDGGPNPALTPENWGLTPWDEGDKMEVGDSEWILEQIDGIDAEEEALLEEDPDADLSVIDLSATAEEMGLADWETRQRLRRDALASIAAGRGRRLVNNGFDTRDRPGPPPSWLTEAELEAPAEVVSLPDSGPGCVILPAPRRRRTASGQAPWVELVAGEFHRHRLDHGSRITFGGPLAFDIALRGGAADHKDVDNVAHDVIAAFNRAFADVSVQIDGYRVYRLSGAQADIRVRLLPIGRLRRLSVSMRQAEELLKAEHGL